MNIHSYANTSENQQIKSDFVNKNVHQNLNKLIRHLHNTADDCEFPEDVDILHGIHETEPDYNECMEDNGWEWDEEDEVWKNGDEELEDCEVRNHCELNYDTSYHRASILEHWVVSDYLFRLLEDEGEKVVELFDLQIWCRTQSGQAIMMDSVISRICDKLGLLIKPNEE